MNAAASLTTFPMHGQHKLSHEGYRTRDGHMIEWFGRLLGDSGSVAVRSRPEPMLLRPTYRRGFVAANTVPIDSWSWKPPLPGSRQRWWWTSRRAYRASARGQDTPIVVWNPFLGVSNLWEDIRRSGRMIAFDMLDDWTNHYAFAPIRPEVTLAYRQLFDRADAVFTNSEATLETACSFGRSDAVLMPNGCDPERFDVATTASGPVTVGYVGKIGRRIDLDLVLSVSAALPETRFVFAGPILDREYAGPLKAQPNIELLGDVHYDRVPALLQTFDIGWVPHRVGEGEVGGDVIKTYEYRAAGLPVVTTPVLGASDRGLTGVRVADRTAQADTFASLIAGRERVPREPTSIPDAATWRTKATTILDRLGIAHG